MNDLCGWPFEQQALKDEQTLEGMVDGMGLRSVLLILQSICYAKSQHIEENWQDHNLAMEWTTTGNMLGRWAKSIGSMQ
jgi:hypothetical protein